MFEPWFCHSRSFPMRTLPANSPQLKLKQHKIKAFLLSDLNDAAIKKEADLLKSVPLPVGSYTPFNTAELAFDLADDNTQYDLFFDATVNA